MMVWNEGRERKQVEEEKRWEEKKRQARRVGKTRWRFLRVKLLMECGAVT